MVCRSCGTSANTDIGAPAAFAAAAGTHTGVAGLLFKSAGPGVGACAQEDTVGVLGQSNRGGVVIILLGGVSVT